MGAEDELRRSFSGRSGTLAESLPHRHMSGYAIQSGLIRLFGISRQSNRRRFASQAILIGD
jgi:hypothetical protein